MGEARLRGQHDYWCAAHLHSALKGTKAEGPCDCHMSVMATAAKEIQREVDEALVGLIDIRDAFDRFRRIGRLAASLSDATSPREGQ